MCIADFFLKEINIVNLRSDADLIIFDLDGTLVKTYTQIFLPGVEQYFQQYFSSPSTSRPKIALATNQGGVGMRYWLEANGRKNIHRYPTQSDVEDRINHVVSTLSKGNPFPVYVCFAYRQNFGNWLPTPDLFKQDPRWQPSWRKPSPGMLLQAMQDAGVPGERTTMVGDRPEDRQAAEAAGSAFAWADQFFGRPQKRKN